LTTWWLAVVLLALATAPTATAASNGGASAGAAQEQGDNPAQDPEQQTAARTGGQAYGQDNPIPTPTVPGAVAQILDGIAYAPSDAPDAVKQMIWAANQIVGMPYLYGGGHKDFVDDGYDCSGTVSFALHGAALLKRPRDSRTFARFGASGVGQWVTIYTNPGHAYMTVAGIRLDTSAADDPSGTKGPRWRPLRKSDRGYKLRHPVGL
jgi:cell wall-associated NlpC family hydrolase